MPTRVSLETLFMALQDRGVLVSGHPLLLAEIFLDLFISDLHAEAIGHGVGSDHSPQRLRARVDFFIKGAGLQAPR